MMNRPMRAFLAFLTLELLTSCAGSNQAAQQPADLSPAPPAPILPAAPAQGGSTMQQAPAATRPSHKGGKVLFLISEQNIEQPVVSWWGESVGEVRLSVTEPVLFNALIQSGYEVIDPADRGSLRVSDAYRRIGVGDQGAMELGRTYGADYVVLGKALATGSSQPMYVTRHSDSREDNDSHATRHGYSREGNDSNYAQRTNMRSASATITAKLIRLADRKVVAFVSGSGDAIHLNQITAGKEALEQAAQQAAENLIAQLHQLSP